jgi:hypothetical protein
MRLRYWQAEWYVWDGTAYRKLAPEDLKAKLSTRIKEEFDRLNATAIQEWQKAGGKNA